MFEQRGRSPAHGRLGTSALAEGAGRAKPLCCAHVQGHSAAHTAFPVLGLRPRLAWGSAGRTPQPWEASPLTLVAVDCFSLDFASGTRSLYKMGHHKRREREPTCSQYPGLTFCHEGASQSFAFSGGAGPPCPAQALPCSPETRPPGAVQRLPTATKGPVVHPTNPPAFSSPASPASLLGWLCRISRCFLGIVPQTVLSSW